MAFKLLTSAKDYVLGLLFPIKCAACEKETETKKTNKLICTDCLKKLRPSFDFYCPLCQAKTADAKLCFSCQMIISNTENKYYLDQLLYPFSYREPAIQKIIKAFKYRFIKDLDKPLAKLMISYLDKIKEKIDFNDSILIPIPLHKRKFLSRGYNQAELLSQEISKNLNLKIAGDCLVKIKSTKDQAKLKENQRTKNLKNVFRCVKPWLIAGKRIILFDDVYTSGATMTEAAKVLKEAGAKEVIGLAIARG